MAKRKIQFKSDSPDDLDIAFEVEADAVASDYFERLNCMRSDAYCHASSVRERRDLPPRFWSDPSTGYIMPEGYQYQGNRRH